MSASSSVYLNAVTHVDHPGSDFASVHAPTAHRARTRRSTFQAAPWSAPSPSARRRPMARASPARPTRRRSRRARRSARASPRRSGALARPPPLPRTRTTTSCCSTAKSVASRCPCRSWLRTRAPAPSRWRPRPLRRSPFASSAPCARTPLAPSTPYVPGSGLAAAKSRLGLGWVGWGVGWGLLPAALDDFVCVTSALGSMAQAPVCPQCRSTYVVRESSSAVPPTAQSAARPIPAAAATAPALASTPSLAASFQSAVSLSATPRGPAADAFGKPAAGQKAPADDPAPAHEVRGSRLTTRPQLCVRERV